MGQDSGDLISLPTPPPPNPAARREAIDAALSKIDGIEEAPARRSPRLAWKTLHRRPAGALVAAAVVAILGIPAIQIALRDNSPPMAEEAAPSDLAAPGQPVAGRSPLAPETAPAAEAVADETALPAPRGSEPSPSAAADSLGFTAGREEKAKMVAPSPPFSAPAAPMMTAPPPPPPPPSADPQAEASASDNIVVTGSRVARPNMESASPISVIQADAVEAEAQFLSRLQTALGSNDRRAVIRLVGFPLRVNFGGERRTYRTPRDVEGDYNRIFTPSVRQAGLGLRANALTARDGGRLRGNARLWFGCGKEVCSSAGAIHIREVTP